MSEPKKAGLFGQITEEAKKFKSKAGPRKIPKVAQDTVPYLECYSNGVFQTEKGVFTQSFTFEDVSFKTRSDEEQQRIYEDYQKFLNTIVPKRDVFLSVIRTKDSAVKKAEHVVAPLCGDEFDIYRKEMSQMVMDKMSKSNNAIKITKLITVRVEAPSVDEGMKELEQAFSEISRAFKKFTKQDVKPLSLAARLEILQQMFNLGEDSIFFAHDEDGEVSVNFELLSRQGLTTKDIVSPEYLKFYGNYFEINNGYGQSMYLEGIANWLNANFFTEVSSCPFEGATTLHIMALPQEEAIKIVHDRSVNIKGEALEKQKKLGLDGYNMDALPTDLKNALNEIEALQDDLTNRDQKIFYTSMQIVHFAHDKEELKKNETVVKNIALKHNCSVKPMIAFQEAGLKSALPVGIDTTKNPRLMTTESLGIMIPFDETVSFDKGGFYYGVNAVNNSIIVYNRLKGQNYNGLVLGSPGSGKSFSAKREMVSVILNTDSDICIIDPDGEYSAIAEAFGGTVIKIAPGNGVHLNPLDMDVDMSQDRDGNPMAMKMDFVEGLMETMLQNQKLSPEQKSVLDKAINQIYKPYIQHLKEMPLDKDGNKRTIDREYCPTLQSLWDALLTMSNPEAQRLALMIEEYANGIHDTFAYKTNVDVRNRVIVYDIKDVGTGMMKELALEICINDVWNRIVENRRAGKWTWFYIDEFHLLLANPSISSYLKVVWKRARKWQGVPTGITQNVEDLLESTEARAIINNSSFVYMMNQSAMDRNMLAELLCLTEADKEAITNADQGCGLIHTGQQTIPFVDDFPENTKLFKLLTTKPSTDYN